MAKKHYIANSSNSQGWVGLAEVASILETIDDSALLARLQEYRWVGGAVERASRLSGVRSLARIRGEFHPEPSQYQRADPQTP